MNENKAINWNQVQDMVDKMTWDKLISQFWVDTRVPISNDLDDWRTLPQSEKDLVNKVLGGLTSLDTLQSEFGVGSLLKDVRTQHEQAVLNNIVFMESVHAKSYSSIFSTLNNNKDIDELFNWIDTNEHLQTKNNIIKEIYLNGSAEERKVASVLLESFLFYSGFYTPLRYLGSNKLASVAEIIKLIIKDESVHGTYIGYKYQRSVEEMTEDEAQSLKSWTYQLLWKLYENEVKYTQSLYDEIGWTEDVKVFLRYNANKALQNLGYEPMFPDTAEDVNPIIINGLSGSSSSHDFFSKVGNSYFVGVVETMKEDDYSFNKGHKK